MGTKVAYLWDQMRIRQPLIRERRRDCPSPAGSSLVLSRGPTGRPAASARSRTVAVSSVCEEEEEDKRESTATAAAARAGSARDEVRGQSESVVLRSEAGHRGAKRAPIRHFEQVGTVRACGATG